MIPSTPLRRHSKAACPKPVRPNPARRNPSAQRGNGGNGWQPFVAILPIDGASRKRGPPLPPAAAASGLPARPAPGLWTVPAETARTRCEPFRARRPGFETSIPGPPGWSAHRPTEKRTRPCCATVRSPHRRADGAELRSPKSPFAHRQLRGVDSLHVSPMLDCAERCVARFIVEPPPRVGNPTAPLAGICRYSAANPNYSWVYSGICGQFSLIFDGKGDFEAALATRFA